MDRYSTAGIQGVEAWGNVARERCVSNADQCSKFPSRLQFVSQSAGILLRHPCALNPCGMAWLAVPFGKSVSPIIKRMSAAVGKKRRPSQIHAQDATKMRECRSHCGQKVSCYKMWR